MEFNLQAVVKYNTISDQLKEIIRKRLPATGQTVYFQSIRPNAAGTTVVPKDRIFDPFANDGKGEYVDIAYVTGHNPNGPILGRIQFRKADGGRIAITGGNRSHENLFVYLYLTNQRIGSNKEPWYVATEGRSKIFSMDEPAQTAKQKLEFKRRVRWAGEIIDKMGDNTLRDFASGLDMKGINQFSDPDEIRLKLEGIAEKDPDKIITLDRDLTIPAKVLVKEAEKLGVIQKDSQLQQYVWPDSGELICVAPPGKDLRDTLVTFLLSIKGIETHKMLQALVDGKKEQKKPVVTVNVAQANTAPSETVTTTISSSGPVTFSVTDPIAPPKKKGGRPPGAKNKK
jgi:hypothetical protein